MLLLLLLTLAEEPDTLIARQRAAVVERCVYDAKATDVTVCGLRNADRFRLPLQTVQTRSDRPADNVAVERTALLHRTSPIQELSPFLVGGGMAGASVRSSFGPGAGSGETAVSGLRPIAP